MQNFLNLIPAICVAVISVIGAVGFIVGAIYYLYIYKKTSQLEEEIFAIKDRIDEMPHEILKR